MSETNQIMKHYNLEPGDLVRIKKRDLVIEGIIMPPYIFTDPWVLVVKLRNGYNIGIHIEEIKELEIISRESIREQTEEIKIISQKTDLPHIKIIGTGGTIASFVDYLTGAVKPAVSVDELLEMIPEALDIAYIESESIMNILSENMRPEYWEIIAEKIYDVMKKNVYRGIVVTHGTDTMSFTASAMAFAIQSKNIPIVFVGSQRSSDRPSSDAALNFIGALVAASKAPFAESVIAMHNSSSDDLIAVHRGVKVRKMHTSRRDTFKSINAKPLAYIDPIKKELIIEETIYSPRSSEEPILLNGFEKRVALIYSYPGIQRDLIEYIIDSGYKGVVIAGTGFGHVPQDLIPILKRGVDKGVAIAVTSQTLYGRVNLKVYQTGREMLRAGVIPCEDMLPEVAYVKLSWVLYRAYDMDRIKEMMLRNYAYEISMRHTEDLFIR